MDGTPEAATEAVEEAGESVYELLRDALITGVAVIVPVVITVYVLNVALGVVQGILTPFVEALKLVQEVDTAASELLIELLAFVTLVGIVLVVGFAAHFRSGEQAISYFDVAMKRIPGVGGVYKSFRKMSDVMLESDTQNFRDVKLIEFPHDGTYTLGFETTRTPDEIQDAAGRDDMITLFLPMAPNPVMGGFLTHVPEERVLDVDMSVEEGLRTIVTTGVATVDPENHESGLSASEMEQLTGFNTPNQVKTQSSAEAETDDEGGR